VETKNHYIYRLDSNSTEVGNELPACHEKISKLLEMSKIHSQSMVEMVEDLKIENITSQALLQVQLEDANEVITKLQSELKKEKINHSETSEKHKLFLERFKSFKQKIRTELCSINERDDALFLLDKIRNDSKKNSNESLIQVETIAKLKVTCEELSSSLTVSKKDNQALRYHIEVAEKKILMMEEEKNIEIGFFRKQMNDLEVKLKSSSLELVAKKSHVEKLANNLAILKEETASARIESSNANITIGSLNEKLNASQKEISNRIHDLSRLKADADLNDGRLRLLAIECEKKDKELQILIKDSGKIDHLKISLHNSVRAQAEGVESSISQMISIQKRLNDLNRAENSVTAKTTQLAKKLSNLRSAVLEKDAVIINLRDLHSTLEMKLEAKEKELDQKISLINRMKHGLYQSKQYNASQRKFLLEFKNQMKVEIKVLDFS
jgi:hypothetical protein